MLSLIFLGLNSYVIVGRVLLLFYYCLKTVNFNKNKDVMNIVCYSLHIDSIVDKPINKKTERFMNKYFFSRKLIRAFLNLNFRIGIKK